MSLKKSEATLLAMAKAEFGRGPFTPTQIGMALGYAQVSASSRVAPALRALVEAGHLEKTKLGHNRAEYRVSSEPTTRAG